MAANTKTPHPYSRASLIRMIDPKESLYSILRFIGSVAKALSSEWAFIGDAALSLIGLRSASGDIEVAISATVDLADHLDRLMTADGWTKIEGPGKIKDAAIYMSRYTKDLGEGVMFCLGVVFTTEDWQRRAIMRRQPESFRDIIIWAVTAEDLIIYKLVADRGYDQSDIDDILDRIKGIDSVYVDSLVSSIGIRHRWVSALTRRQDRRDMGM